MVEKKKEGKTPKVEEEKKLNIYEKLMAIQSELKAPKTQMNKFGGYKYRSLEDILEALKPLLAKHKATLVIEDQIAKIDDRFYVCAKPTLINVENPEEKITTVAYARESLVKKGMDDSQITGATSSYARKYALNALFAIDDTRDADTQNNNTDITLKEMDEEKRNKIINALKKVAPEDFKINLDMKYKDARAAYEMFTRKK